MRTIRIITFISGILFAAAVVVRGAASATPANPMPIRTTESQSQQSALYPNTPVKDFFSDGPWVHRSGVSSPIPYITVIKDANEDAVLLDYIAYYRQDDNVLIGAYDPSPDITIMNDLWGLRVNSITPAILGLEIGDTARIRVDMRFRDQGIWHIYRYHLETYIAEPWPSLGGWFRGDTHHHAFFTDNIFEFGSEMEFDTAVAKDIGLSWVTLTDHSYDVTATEWNSMKSQAQSLSSSSFRIIPGLEFSVDGNDTNDNVDDRIHLLGFGFSNWISGPDTVSSFDVYANQPRTLAAIMNDIQSQGGLAYAAHPESDPISVGGYGLLTPWPQEKYNEALTYPAFAGLQSFNTRIISYDNTSVETDDMNPFPWTYNPDWDAEWLRGILKYNALLRQNIERKIFIAGGADAHGDANYQTYNAYGAFDIAANNNAYGKIHTVAWLPNGLSDQNILNAMRNGQAIVSDGPLGVMYTDYGIVCSGRRVVAARIGDRTTYQPSDRLVINALSTSEFGPINRITLHLLNPSEERHTNLPTVNGLNVVKTMSMSSLGMSAPFALWLETETTLGYRSFSNPIWFDGGTLNTADKSQYSIPGPCPPAK